jgi:hypothetical protein
MEHFKKLMEKKRAEGKGPMSDAEHSAHSSVLHDMMNALDQDGMEKVKGLKKVTVAAKDQTGLNEGLDKAKEIVNEGDKEHHSGNEHEGEMADDSEEKEYDDQDEEGPNHMPTEHEATSFGAQDAHEGSPETDEEAPEHEMKEGSPEHIAHLKKQLEDHKAEIAHLRAPKSFY